MATATTATTGARSTSRALAADFAGLLPADCVITDEVVALREEVGLTGPAVAERVTAALGAPHRVGS